MKELMRNWSSEMQLYTKVEMVEQALTEKQKQIQAQDERQLSTVSIVIWLTD